VEIAFHNTGLYNVDGRGSYPPPNTGVHAVTGDPADMGRFKAPTLRNIALTAPWGDGSKVMNDSSVRSLQGKAASRAANGRHRPATALLGAASRVDPAAGGARSGWAAGQDW